MRFKVDHYSDGRLCVVDTLTQHVVKYHDSVRWETTFRVADRREDVVDILAALKKKALNGDVGAARIVLDYTIGPPEKAPTTINVDKVIVHEPTGIPKSVSKARQRVVELIANEGPLDARTIAVRTGISPDVIEKCLEHDWFEDEQDGYHITNQARAEVIGGDEDD